MSKVLPKTIKLTWRETLRAAAAHDDLRTIPPSEKAPKTVRKRYFPHALRDLDEALYRTSVNLERHNELMDRIVREARPSYMVPVRRQVHGEDGAVRLDEDGKPLIEEVYQFKSMAEKARLETWVDEKMDEPTEIEIYTCDPALIESPDIDEHMFPAIYALDFVWLNYPNRVAEE